MVKEHLTRQLKRRPKRTLLRRKGRLHRVAGRSSAAGCCCTRRERHRHRTRHLRLELAAGCPKIAAGKIMDLCGVINPDPVGRQ
jgi:hypothetical protein